jgi:hypothetical protein
VTSVAGHLLLKRADGGLKGGQLSFQAVAPEGQRAQLSLLMAPTSLLGLLGGGITGKRGEHGKLMQFMTLLAVFHLPMRS